MSGLTSGALDLRGVHMQTAETDRAGVCSPDTLLTFEQHGSLVTGHYRGGPILAGYLIGHLSEMEIRFRYIQADANGNLDSGSSKGIFSRLKDDRLQLVEHFRWETRPEAGTNVFIQVRR